MRDRKGWKALGYESFVEYGEKELGFASTHLYRLAESAEISLQIGYSPIGENVQPPEGQLRPLTQVPESVRKEIWDEATRKAEEAGKKVTAKAVSEAVEEWKQRSEDWRQQSNGQRKKIRDLEQQIDLLQARPAEPVTVIPDDYEALKQAKQDLQFDLADLRQKQRELVRQQVAEKLRERESELEEIDQKVSAASARLEGLQRQIDRYTLRQREASPSPPPSPTRTRSAAGGVRARQQATTCIGAMPTIAYACPRLMHRVGTLWHCSI